MSKLTVAGTEFSPRNVKLSMTGMSSTWRLAVLRFRLKVSALSGTRSVQNNPDGAMSPLKS
jgi:hypothetical protein